jgi:membrane protein YdbS with pleckstrin-like domain
MVEQGGKVIKPPVERITSGKIFRPSRAFLYKMWAQGVMGAALIWSATMLSFVGLAYLIGMNAAEHPPGQVTVATYWDPINFWMVVLNLIWLVPYLIFVPAYVRSIEYSVKSESGETMPEVYVRKGIVTISRKHVPFRTITNIESKAGPFDRLFGIGSVSIETAGYSGSQTTGPEEKLEGIVFYEEVRDFILNELRKYRAPYTTTTEVAQPKEEPVPRGEGLDDEILITLREIKDLLRSQRK